MQVLGVEEPLMCKAFLPTLKGLAQKWFLALPSRSIRCFNDLADRFLTHYAVNIKLQRNLTHLNLVHQDEGEALKTAAVPSLSPPPRPAFLVVFLKDLKVFSETPNRRRDGAFHSTRISEASTQFSVVMASDAPRARIDQFFASKKKRKFESPALKSPRVNKDAKISIEGSPGTKGSLESYLVNSKDNSTPLHEAGGSAVKRNLTLDLGLISKHGKEVAVSSRQAHSQGFETTGEGQKFEVLSNTGFAARELPKDSLESTGVQENLELKQFASDFLSLYCRLAEPQISLRKCNNVPVAEATESLTPGLSATKHVAGTPSSGHRTSIFSPGETFWNEAIEVADGLFAGNKKIAYQVTKETEALNTRHEILSSNNLKNGGCGNKSNKLIEGIADKVSGVGMVPAIVPIRKIGKELDKEVSPLPVKHFDFALEDKFFSQSKNCQILSGQQAQHVSAANQYVHSTCNEAQVNGSSHEENVGTSKYAASKSKVEVFVQDNGSPMFNTPTERSGDIKAISESSEDDTPSSFALQKDRLDLSNWLPPEICSVYKKKGISKLYTWQVLFYTFGNI
nr:helicase and polymerase-containing protein TEBICHI isoform X1 [Ipomoea batatas]